MAKEKTLVIIIKQTKSDTGGTTTKTEYIGDINLKNVLECRILEDVIRKSIYKRK